MKHLPRLRNTYVVHNGVDELLFYPAPRDQKLVGETPVILYVGRLHPSKGVHVLMEAMRILQRRGVAALCRVVGSSFSGGSQPTRYVKHLVRDKPSNVIFDGYRVHTEVPEAYRRADMVCCPSIWAEPFGNINVEAMACGVPVVATRVGGIPEIAAEGGILLVSPNSASELADALHRLIADWALRQDVAMQGLKSVKQRFTWAVACNRYKTIAETL